MATSRICYSRNLLLNIRYCWKIWSVSGHASSTQQVANNVWTRLKSLNLLASTRGKRGGKTQPILTYGRKINVVVEGSSSKTFQSRCWCGRNPNNLICIAPSTNFNNNETSRRKNLNSTEEISTRTTSVERSRLKVAHLNVRSIKNRDHLLQVRELMRESDYDVLALSETWLNSTVSNAEVEIEGYKLTRLDRLRKTGGGVCLYSRSSLKVKCLKDLSGISDSDFHQLWVQIQLKNLRSVIICVTYRPDYCPTSCFLDNFMEKYTQALTLGKEIVVFGDLNCNLLKPNSTEAIALLDMCRTVNLTQLIKDPTRVTETSSSLIDVIMTSNTSLVESSGVVLSHISDHYLIHASLKLKLPKLPDSYVHTRSYKKYTPDQFVADLQQMPWQETFNIDDASDMLDDFNNKFIKVLDLHAPIKTIKIKYRSCPFINSELRELMYNRDSLLKRARRTRLSVDWDLYREMRNEVKIKLRKAEKRYVQEKLEHSYKSSSKWKIIRNCIPRKESSKQVYTRELKVVANQFNHFFTSVGPRAAEDCQSLITLHNLPQPTTRSPPEITEKFHFKPVTCAEVKKVIMAFPSNRAPGEDKVPMSTIKDALTCILPVLTAIINRSLLTSVFPSAWKTAEVVPLPKDGDHEVPNNNRPVSLLPVASKVCERVALNQLTSYMERHLTKHQSGNKQRHSCETLTVYMTDKILEAMDSKELTVMVLLDLSKAFDSINHCNLLSKLQRLGFERSALEWISSYLTDRKQHVRIDSVISEAAFISHGVPQGSILGPALFNIYLNDLPSVPRFGFLESFVDDSKLYFSFPVKNADDVMYNINEDLHKIASWCCQNSLLINPNKTKLLVLGTRQMLQKLLNDFHVTVLGKRIDPAKSARDLGIQLDPTLSFDEHVANTSSSCFASLLQINRVKHLLDRKTLENVMTSLVFSKLFYCSTVWSSTSKKNIAKLQNVQNFAARIVTGKGKYEHITPLLKELSWISVTNKLKYFVGLLAFKCLNGLAPEYLSSCFKARSAVHGRNTRNKHKLNIPVYKSASGQRTFKYRAVSLWNQLPTEITDCNDIKTFKRRLKEHLIE